MNISEDLKTANLMKIISKKDRRTTALTKTAIRRIHC